MSSKAQLPKILGITSIHIDQTKTDDNQRNILKLEVNTDQGIFVITDKNSDGQYDFGHGDDYEKVDQSLLSHFQKELPLERVQRAMLSRSKVCQGVAKNGKPYQWGSGFEGWSEKREFTLKNGQVLRLEAAYGEEKKQYELKCVDDSYLDLSVTIFCSKNSTVYKDFVADVLLAFGKE